MRPAEKSDIPILKELYVQHCANSLIGHQRNKDIWEYGLFIASRETPAARTVAMIEDLQGEIVAYAQTFPHGTALRVRELGVKEGHSWRAVSLFLVRELKKQADELNRKREKPVTHISFKLGETHPVYDALGRQLEKIIKPYTWYIRVADVSRFLRHIAPVLERRLRKSVMAGYSSALRLSFYRSSLTLRFEQGILSEIGTYEPANYFDFDAAFPDLSFLHLLFGCRSLAELDAALVDCFAANAEAAVLLDCLFPKRPSDINPLD